MYKHIVLGFIVVVGLVLALFEVPTRAAEEANTTKKVEFVCDDGKLTLNGTAIEFPCDLAVLTSALGEPDRVPVGGLEGKTRVPIWDKLGIVSHLSDDQKVMDISFRLGDSPYRTQGEFAAKGKFTGELTVDGVKFEGVVTFEQFSEKRKANGTKRLGGESIEYANGHTLALSCKEPAKGPIWHLAVFVKSKR